MIGLSNLLLFFLIIISTIGFSYLFNFFKILKDEKALEITVRFAFGIGFISYLYFLLTAFHLLNIYSFYSTLIFSIILFIYNNLHYKPSIKINNFTKKENIALSFFLLLFIITNLFYSLFYPVFYDSMLYHLAVPSYYYQNNGFKLWEHNFLSNLPLTVEFFYLYLITGKAFVLSKLVNFASSLGILVIISSIYKETTKKNSILLLLLVYSIPQFGFLSSSSKPDIISMLFVLITIFFFLKYIKNKNNIFLFLSSIFSGLSISSKYINAFYIAAMIISYILLEKKINKKIIKEIGIVLIITFLIISPWLIKNSLLTGNPVYPYLNKIFKSKYWTSELSQNFSKTIKRGNFSIPKLLIYPFKILTKPYSYGMTAVYGYLLITLLIFAFFYEKKKEFKFILFIIIFSFISLLLFSRVPRYFLTAFVLLSILINSGVDESFKKRNKQRKILNLLILFLLIVNLFYQIVLQERFFKGIRYLTLKRKYKNIEYLESLPYYQAFKFINTNLKNTDKVIFLGEDRSFYLMKKAIVSSFNDKNPLIEMIKKGYKNHSLIKALKKRGITYILYYEKGLKRMMKKSVSYYLTKKQYKELICFLNKLKLVYSDYKTYNIFKIT